MNVELCPICKNVEPIMTKDDSVKGLDYEISWNARCPQCGTVVWVPANRRRADIIRLWNLYSKMCWGKR